jgi:hypothetical protein
METIGALKFIYHSSSIISADSNNKWQSTGIGFYNGLNNSGLFILSYGYTLTGGSTND